MRITRWDQILSTDESNEVLSLLARWHASCLTDEGNRSKVMAMLDGRDWRSLCHYEPPLTLSLEDYSHSRQVAAFFSKRSDIKLEGIDPKATAWETFVEAEALCKETNECFRLNSDGEFYFLPRVESVFYVAQRKISSILGNVPVLSELRLRFGPGATTQVRKRDASARRKLSQMFCCSEDAVESLPDLLAEVPDWSQASRLDDLVTDCSVSVDNARVDFVRKTAKTDRTIAVEPMLNGMVQLAIGDHISDRLRQAGVNLRDQTLNQRLAREGSITGALATLDLSSASDTVASGLVLSLLPVEWVELLGKFRCSRADTPKGLVDLEKFSTMGNGFTFALESLIFFALAKAATELSEAQGPVSVYGDDIIVPTAAFDLVVEALVAAGFRVNAKKSFSTGSFRESCGKDYYSGISVRPCYIKDAVSGESLFILHNFYVRNWLPEPASLVLDHLSDEVRIYGPDGFGDGHLLGDYVANRHGVERGWSGYTFETYTRKPNRRFYTLGADYVFPSYSIYISSADEIDSSVYPVNFELKRNDKPLGFRASGDRKGTRPFGSIRPDRQQSSYDRMGHLSDPLPGSKGYKRIKIYTLGLIA